MQDIVIPRRATALGPADRQSVGPEAAGIFGLLKQGVAESVAQALVTLVEVEGGSSRAIGAQMAVLADGRYCGYLSGGCVEAAIASEAVRCLRNGRDEVLRFGVGSPFLDIRLPCGGSIEVHIHVHPAPDLIAAAVKLLSRRLAFGIEFGTAAGTARLLKSISPTRRTGWHDDRFLCCYAPVTRLLLIGRGVELEQVAQLGVTAGLEVMAFCADDESAATAAANGIAARRLSTPADPPTLPADPWTAVIFLFHDHEWETALLRAALDTNAFLIGAMGSHRAHRQRRERLIAAGVPRPTVDRIKGPVGLFGPTRDATSLAISILAEVTQRRNAETA